MRKIKNITKEVRNIFLLTLLLVGLFILGLTISYNLVLGQSSSANQQYKIVGWAWSDNIGWILFGTTTTTEDYWVRTTGTGSGERELTGYAWSSNIGWISFNKNDLTGCPSNPCKATLNLSTGKFSGWARALAASTSNLYETGGWTGWISLSSSTQYGLDLKKNWQTFSSLTSSSWAWGGGDTSSSSVIGWIINYNLATSPITAFPNKYILRVNIATGTGMVKIESTSSAFSLTFSGSSGDATTTYIEGWSDVTIYASSTDGTQYVSLSGGCTATGTNGTSSCNFTMDSDKTVNVFFSSTAPGTGDNFTLSISDFKVYTAYCTSTVLWNSTSTFPVSEYTRNMASSSGFHPFSGNIANKSPDSFASTTTQCPETDVGKPIDIGFKASCRVSTTTSGVKCPENYKIDVIFNKTNTTSCSVSFQGLTFSSSIGTSSITYTVNTSSLPTDEIRINNFCFPRLVPGNTTSIEVSLVSSGSSSTDTVKTKTELRIFNYQCISGFCRQGGYNGIRGLLELNYCKYWENSSCGLGKVEKYNMAELIRRIILNIMSRIR